MNAIFTSETRRHVAAYLSRLSRKTYVATDLGLREMITGTILSDAEAMVMVLQSTNHFSVETAEALIKVAFDV